MVKEKISSGGILCESIIKKETTRVDSFFKTKGIYNEQWIYSKSATAGVTGISDTVEK